MLSHSSPGELTRKYCNCYKLHGFEPGQRPLVMLGIAFSHNCASSE